MENNMDLGAFLFLLFIAVLLVGLWVLAKLIIKALTTDYSPVINFFNDKVKTIRYFDNLDE